MKRTRLTLPVLFTIFLSACATTSNSMPEAERSRTYSASFDTVWEQAARAADDAKFVIRDRHKEDGVLVLRSAGSVSDRKGHDIHIIVTRQGESQTRVDVSAEALTEVSWGDLGKSKKVVREFLAALDSAMRRR